MKKTGKLSIMKNALSLVLLLSGLLLYGCGMGGGTTETSGGGNATSNPGGTPSSAGPTSSFTLYLVDSDGAKAVARAFSAGSPQTATDVRVVIWSTVATTTYQPVCNQWENDANGDLICAQPGNPVPVTTYTKTLFNIQDLQPTGNAVTIQIPLGTFTLDVITYIKEKDANNTVINNSILKYGHAVLTITSGGSSGVTMHTVAEILNMTVPDPVPSTGKFDVTLNTNRLPFGSVYNMTMSGVGPSVTSPDTASNKCNFTAPTSTTGGTLSFQGTFFIDSSFLNQGEKASDWKRDFPNSAYNETLTSTLSQLISINQPI